MSALVFYAIFLTVLYFYLLIGVTLMVKDFIPWICDDVYESETPPSIYKEMAWSMVWTWPVDVYHDIIWFYNHRKEGKR